MYEKNTATRELCRLEIAQRDAYTVVNLSLALEPPAVDWQVTFAVNNTTDELYAAGGNSSLDTGSGYAEIAHARPRQYFIRALPVEREAAAARPPRPRHGRGRFAEPPDPRLQPAVRREHP